MKPNTAPIVFLSVLITTPGGCGRKIKKPADSTLIKLSKNKWSIRVERRYKGHFVSGHVVVKVPPGSTTFPHVKVAGARAFQTLAKSRLAAKDFKGAIACAQAGIKELGGDYRKGLKVKDDTSLRINLAEELAGKGRLKEASDELVQALALRLKMYAQTRAKTLVK